MWSSPAADYDRYDAILDEAKSRLPRCSVCGEPVTDDHLFVINDEIICEECLVENYRKNTEDYCYE